MSQSSTNRESYCTFRVDSLLFGVEVQQVQEVIRKQPTTKVPLAPTVVHGLMNLRGQIVSVMNLRQRLGLSVKDDTSTSMNVVIRTDEGPMSLLVDEIGDVVQVDKGNYEPPPETLQGAPRDFIQGAYKLTGELLLILDTQRVQTIAA